MTIFGPNFNKGMVRKQNVLNVKIYPYLMCHRYHKGENKDDIETVKFILSNGDAFHSILSCCAFGFCDDTLPSIELKASLKIPNSKRSNSISRVKNTNENMINEMNAMKDELFSMKVTVISTKLSTELIMRNNRHDLQSFKPTDTRAATTPLSKISYAQSVKRTSTTPAVKRARLDTTIKTPMPRKSNVRLAKSGTKINSNLSVVPKKNLCQNQL